jgi:TrmH RNA methyltransferase
MHSEVNAFCSQLAARRKVYREVEPDELRRIAGTAMHGGVVALAEPKAIGDLDEAAAQRWAAAGEMLVVLDGIGNPQNLGAIARTAAFLGLKRLVVSDHPAQAGLSNAAYRIAKGGLEGLDVYRAADLPAVLRRLRAHYHVVGTALGQGGPVEALPMAPKPVALVLGNEEDGLDPATLAACHSVVSIPGGGAVQSLNVSAVAAILIYSLLGRARRSATAP